MLIILDSNEFIFALGAQEPRAKTLLDILFTNTANHSLRLPRTVFEEVQRNLSIEAFKEFILMLLSANISIDEDTLVPFELGLKYELAGFKYADAFIAAYAEFVGADILVSENRHFLSRQTNLPFKIVNADNCLKLIKASLR